MMVVIAGSGKKIGGGFVSIEHHTKILNQPDYIRQLFTDFREEESNNRFELLYPKVDAHKVQVYLFLLLQIHLSYVLT